MQDGLLAVAGFVGPTVSHDGDEQDAFVALLDSTDGEPRWTRLLGTLGGDDAALSVAVDGANERVVVAGRTQGDLNNVTGVSVGSGNSAGFLCGLHLDSGAVVPDSTEILGGTGQVVQDAVNSVRVYRGGEDGVYKAVFGGQRSGKTAFGEYSAQGLVPWSGELLSNGADSVRAACACGMGDAGQALFIAGSTLSTVFSGEATMAVPASGLADGFVARIDPVTTQVVWLEFVATSGADEVEDMACDCAHGMLYVAGHTTGSLAHSERQNAGGADVFLAKLRAHDGRQEWTRMRGSSGDDRVLALVATRHALFVVGDTTSDAIDGRVSVGGAKDALIMSFNHHGTHQWTERLGGNGTDSATAVVAGSLSGKRQTLFAAGATSSAVFLGRRTQGDGDAWVARLVVYSVSSAHDSHSSGAGVYVTVGAILALIACSIVFAYQRSRARQAEERSLRGLDRETLLTAIHASSRSEDFYQPLVEDHNELHRQDERRIVL